MSVATLAEPPLTGAAAAPRWLRPRLSLLMFLLYAVPGSWLPLFSIYLQHLRFTPLQIGWCFATYALGSLAAPLLAGQLADRWLPAERCVALFGLIAGVLLWLLPGTTDPLAVFLLTLAAWLVFVPAITLCASLSFAQLPNPERDYGGVRLWGTAGWLLPCLGFGFWFTVPGRDLADTFRLAGVLAFALAGYALTLPTTPPLPRPASAFLAPLAALRLFRDRSFAVYCAASLGLYITIAFGAQLNPLLLKQLGFDLSVVAPLLTLPQWVEIATLTLLPMCLLRLGQRGTMLLGMMAWVLALAGLTLGQPVWLAVAALGGYGVCVPCFLVAGQLFVNRSAAGDVRASAQGLLTFGNGIGQLIGNVLVGAVRQAFDGAFVPTYATALALGGVLLLTFLIGFRERGR